MSDNTTTYCSHFWVWDMDTDTMVAYVVCGQCGDRPDQDTLDRLASSEDEDEEREPEPTLSPEEELDIELSWVLTEKPAIADLSEFGIGHLDADPYEHDIRDGVYHCECCVPF